jgi:DNA polymerase III alpha subunit
MSTSPPPEPQFAYLYVHTHLSLGGGPAMPEIWCRRAAELGYTTSGAAERSPLASLPALRRAALESGIAAVYGMEVALALPQGTGRKSAQAPEVAPALLLARDAEGIGNLMRLAAQAYAHWPSPEIDPLPWDGLTKHAGGLAVVLLGWDERGELSPVAGVTAKKQPAWVGEIAGAFPGCAYIGLPHAGRDGDDNRAARTAHAAGEIGIPIAAVPPARYPGPEGARAYLALRAARGLPLDGPAEGEHMRAPEEVAALFAQWPAAVENAARLAQECAQGTAGWQAPRPAGEAAEHLRALAEKGPGAAGGITPEMRTRLEAEIEAAARIGQVGAWSALAGVVEWARRERVPLGAPVGAAAGSMLAYVLGVSPLPPTEHERPAWIAGGDTPPPGVELPSARFAAVAAALAREHGSERVAAAASVLEITPVQAARGAAHAYGLTPEESASPAEAARGGWGAFHGDNEAAATALALKGAPLTFRPDRTVLWVAPRQAYLQGGDVPPAPILPSTGGAAWLPWTEADMASVGYAALCLPSTRALDTLDAALEQAKRAGAPGFPAGDLDPSTFPPFGEDRAALLESSDLANVPYLTPGAVKKWAWSDEPGAVAALLARSLYHGKPPMPDPKPAAWDEVMASTDGALLFTDQARALLAALGISAEDAGTIRAALRHPSSVEGKAGRLLFVQACADAGLSDAEAESTWKALASASGKLLSRDVAAAWGRVALWCVAAMAGHPPAYLAGALRAAFEHGGRSAVAAPAAQAKRLGIALLPPDASRAGEWPATMRQGNDWAIQWGLAMLPGWQGGAAERFLGARPSGGFNTLAELARTAGDAGLSAAQVSALALAGGCDHLGGRARCREAVVEMVPALVEWAAVARAEAQQADLFSVPAIEPPDESATFETEPPTPRTLYLRCAWEESGLGAGLTETRAMDGLRDALRGSGGLSARLASLVDVGDGQVGESVTVVGLLCSIRLLPPAEGEGDPVAVGLLESYEGSIELVAFPPGYKRHAALWTEGNLLVVTARLSKHADGEIYLLCEHLAPFHGEEHEETLTVTVKAPKRLKGAEPVPAPTPQPEPVGAAAPAASLTASVPVREAVPLPAPAHPHAGQEPPNYSLIISIPPAADDHVVIDSMISLNNLLSGFPGPDMVTVRVPYTADTKRWTSARLPWGVSYTQQLDARIRRLLGDESLAVIRLAG